MRYTKLTPEDLVVTDKYQEIRRAADRVELFEEKTSEDDLDEFRIKRARQKGENKRVNVTLRLKPKTLQKAKMLGKGYSAVLSQIVEGVMNDPSLLAKFL
ncbi:MAG: hypothetical protein IJ744_02225 [Lachnospiraceae bacterium]|nr:hypothetical protein [Lachnospiraceae bacterium]